MSFQGFVDTGPRSACDTSDPSDSRRSTRRSADDTTSSRPSGKKSMHIGNEATSASTVGEPSAATEMTRPAPQSESHSRSSRQRGDSPNTMPSISTSMGEETLLDARTHRRDRTSYSRDHRRNRLPPGPSAETTSCPAAAHLVDRCEAALKPLPSGTQVEPPDADPLHANEPFGLLEAAVKALGPVPERLGVVGGETLNVVGDEAGKLERPQHPGEMKRLSVGENVALREGPGRRIGVSKSGDPVVEEPPAGVEHGGKLASVVVDLILSDVLDHADARDRVVALAGKLAVVGDADLDAVRDTGLRRALACELRLRLRQRETDDTRSVGAGSVDGEASPPAAHIQRPFPGTQVELSTG